MNPTTSPQMLLDVPLLDNNIALYADWASARNVVLAPHIKTTMTREIVDRQMGAGAWGVTVATLRQASTALSWGRRRILIANEILFQPDLEQLRRWLETDSSLEIYLLVDSPEGVRRCAEIFSGAVNLLRLLIDIGAPGGRTGVRRRDDALALAHKIASEDGIVLAGISAYEGVAPNTRTPQNLADVDSHCRSARDTFDAMASLFTVDHPVFTIGGSAFQDRAVEFLPQTPSMNVLRSGCYVIHDHGTYAEVSPVPGLRPAAIVRTMVLSVPEPGLAVLNAGKRELAYDAGPPIVVAGLDSAGEPLTVGGEVTRLFDHHSIVKLETSIEPGTFVDLGVSHPCSLFDRWRDVTAVDVSSIQVWHPSF